jgi:hypothetical protein
MLLADFPDYRDLTNYWEHVWRHENDPFHMMHALDEAMMLPFTAMSARQRRYPFVGAYPVLEAAARMPAVQMDPMRALSNLMPRDLVSSARLPWFTMGRTSGRSSWMYPSMRQRSWR